MNWGLTQGILGRNLASLSPSSAALGPNIYLREQDFLKMLGLALVVHGIIFVVAAMFPAPEVTNIPVRAISFKLGDAGRITANISAPIAAMPELQETLPSAPVMQASKADRIAPMTQPQPEPKPLEQAKPEPVTPPRPMQKNPPKQKVIPITEPVRKAPLENPPPALQPMPESKPAIAPTPQQYVREVGAPTPQMLSGLPNPEILTTDVPARPRAASPAGTGAEQAGGSAAVQQAEQVIRERYTQQISGWVQRHKLYPAAAGGREGRVVVRVRIDRGGTVRYYAIEESSRMDILDAAAIDMIRRANPMPAVPSNYPTGDLIEFLIPITFRAPT